MAVSRQERRLRVVLCPSAQAHRLRNFHPAARHDSSSDGPLFKRRSLKAQQTIRHLFNVTTDKLSEITEN